MGNAQCAGRVYQADQEDGSSGEDNRKCALPGRPRHKFPIATQYLFLGVRGIVNSPFRYNPCYPYPIPIHSSYYERLLRAAGANFNDINSSGAEGVMTDCLGLMGSVINRVAPPTSSTTNVNERYAGTLYQSGSGQLSSSADTRRNEAGKQLGREKMAELVRGPDSSQTTSSNMAEVLRGSDSSQPTSSNMAELLRGPDSLQPTSSNMAELIRYPGSSQTNASTGKSEVELSYIKNVSNEPNLTSAISSTVSLIHPNGPYNDESTAAISGPDFRQDCCLPSTINSVASSIARKSHIPLEHAKSFMTKSDLDFPSNYVTVADSSRADLEESVDVQNPGQNRQTAMIPVHCLEASGLHDGIPTRKNGSRINAGIEENEVQELVDAAIRCAERITDDKEVQNLLIAALKCAQEVREEETINDLLNAAIRCAEEEAKLAGTNGEIGSKQLESPTTPALADNDKLYLESGEGLTSGEFQKKPESFFQPSSSEQQRGQEASQLSANETNEPNAGYDQLIADKSQFNVQMDSKDSPTAPTKQIFQEHKPSGMTEDRHGEIEGAASADKATLKSAEQPAGTAAGAKAASDGSVAERKNSRTDVKNVINEPDRSDEEEAKHAGTKFTGEIESKQLESPIATADKDKSYLESGKDLTSGEFPKKPEPFFQPPSSEQQKDQGTNQLPTNETNEPNAGYDQHIADKSQFSGPMHSKDSPTAPTEQIFQEHKPSTMTEAGAASADKAPLKSAEQSPGTEAGATSADKAPLKSAEQSPGTEAGAASADKAPLKSAEQLAGTEAKAASAGSVAERKNSRTDVKNVINEPDRSDEEEARHAGTKFPGEIESKQLESPIAIADKDKSYLESGKDLTSGEFPKKPEPFFQPPSSEQQRGQETNQLPANETNKPNAGYDQHIADKSQFSGPMHSKESTTAPTEHKPSAMTEDRHGEIEGAVSADKTPLKSAEQQEGTGAASADKAPLKSAEQPAGTGAASEDKAPLKSAEQSAGTGAASEDKAPLKSAEQSAGTGAASADKAPLKSAEQPAGTGAASADKAPLKSAEQPAGTGAASADKAPLKSAEQPAGTGAASADKAPLKSAEQPAGTGAASEGKAPLKSAEQPAGTAAGAARSGAKAASDGSVPERKNSRTNDMKNVNNEPARSAEEEAKRAGTKFTGEIESKQLESPTAIADKDKLYLESGKDLTSGEFPKKPEPFFQPPSSEQQRGQETNQLPANETNKPNAGYDQHIADKSQISGQMHSKESPITPAEQILPSSMTEDRHGEIEGAASAKAPFKSAETGAGAKAASEHRKNEPVGQPPTEKSEQAGAQSTKVPKHEESPTGVHHQFEKVRDRKRGANGEVSPKGTGAGAKAASEGSVAERKNSRTKEDYGYTSPSSNKSPVRKTKALSQQTFPTKPRAESRLSIPLRKGSSACTSTTDFKDISALFSKSKHPCVKSIKNPGVKSRGIKRVRPTDEECENIGKGRRIEEVEPPCVPDATGACPPEDPCAKKDTTNDWYFRLGACEERQAQKSRSRRHQGIAIAAYTAALRSAYEEQLQRLLCKTAIPLSRVPHLRRHPLENELCPESPPEPYIPLSTVEGGRGTPCGLPIRCPFSDGSQGFYARFNQPYQPPPGCGFCGGICPRLQSIPQHCCPRPSLPPHCCVPQFQQRPMCPCFTPMNSPQQCPPSRTNPFL